MKPITVRWVLAHDPIELFIRAAERFSEIVEEHAPGRFNIEVMTLSEYSARYNNGKPVAKSELLGLMASGQLEMSQMYTYVLSQFNPDLNVLDLPFLFRDHDHSARVFEGKIGQSLLDGYSRNDSKIQGMAFTYSGGFKHLALSEHADSITDLANAKIRISNSPVSKDTFDSLGAKPVNLEIEQLTRAMQDGTVDGGECTWPRLYSMGAEKVTRTVIDTEHSLLLTNIIINSDFFSGLDPELQAIMSTAAVEAARYERDISVADVAPTTARALADGIKVIKLDNAQREQFRQATAHMYNKYETEFTTGLIDSIKAS